MTLFLETSRPFQWRPWRFSSDVMVRFGWGWLAICWLRVSFREFCETDYDWVVPKRYQSSG